MRPWNDHLLVQVDDVYDLENASDGVSRFGAYLRQNSGLFRDGWSDEPAPVKDPAEFVVHAWTVATGPIMAPGYVRVRPDLHGITLHRDDDDGSLYADVRVPLRHHHLFTGSKRFPYAWQDWEAERDYGDPLDYPSRLEPRSAQKLAVLATAVVRVPGKDWPHLVTPTAFEGRALVDDAREAVRVVAQHINDDAGPIVARVLE